MMTKWDQDKKDKISHQSTVAFHSSPLLSFSMLLRTGDNPKEKEYNTQSNGWSSKERQTL
jgi:hypothetical protein